MLSNDDREWLEDKFKRVHERIDKVEETLNRKGSDIHKLGESVIRLEFEKCNDMKEHEEKHHNPGKTLGLLALLIGVVTGILELGKWLFRKE